MVHKTAFVHTSLTLPRVNLAQNCRLRKHVRIKRTPIFCHPALQSAIKQKKLDDIGRTVHLNSNGTLCSPLLSDTNVSSDWNDAIDYAVELLACQLGDSLRSLYLRGSVAAGHAYLDGRSDLDFIALSTTRATPPELRQFPFVRRVDISYYDPEELPSNVRFILLAYCVHLYGVDVRHQFGCIRPGADSLMNIRADLKRARNHQWFLKRALRSLVDALGPSIRLHARDIVPCARILAQARPQFAQVACRATVAAASLKPDESIVRDIADWCDIEYIGIRCGKQSFSMRMAPSSSVPSMSVLLQSVVKDNLFAARGILSLLRNDNSIRFSTFVPSFVRDKLPEIAISNMNSVKEVYNTRLSSIFRDDIELNEPIIYRRALEPNTSYLNDCTKLIEELHTSFYPADVRVSSGAEFMFCRMNHEWDGFIAPSTLVRMSPREFLYRACDSQGRVYMQTEVSLNERLFRIKSGVAQRERRWICTHGTVSTLHYDAAHSALAVLTGVKRMLFFPPNALPRMGVYLDGHPLARRAMVDLTRPNAALFSDFWRFDADEALEVWIYPGDVVVFPAFWSHYTESHAAEHELCAAHTVRWV